MINSLRRFAPIGLYVALLALLTAGGLYVVFNTFNLAVQISLGVAVLGVASFIIIDTDRALKALTGRQARYGSNALVLTLAVIGVIFVVNYLAYKNPSSLGPDSGQGVQPIARNNQNPTLAKTTGCGSRILYCKFSKRH